MIRQTSSIQKQKQINVVPVEFTLEIIERGQKRVVDGASRCGQGWVPASEHFTQTHQILHHNGSSKEHTHTHTHMHVLVVNQTEIHILHLIYEQRPILIHLGINTLRALLSGTVKFPGNHPILCGTAPHVVVTDVMHTNSTE